MIVKLVFAQTHFGLNRNRDVGTVMRDFTAYFVTLLSILLSSSAAAQTAPIQTGPYATEEEYQQERFNKTVLIGFEEALGLVRAVELQISDQVDGGCWTNADAVEARLRVELERSGIAVFDEPLAFRTATAPVLELVVLGYRVERSGCVASARMELKYPVRDYMGSLGYTGKIFAVSGISVLWSTSVIMNSGGKLDEMVMSNAQEWVDTLNADISKGRRASSTSQFLDTWNAELPMTAREWEAQWANYRPE